MSNFIHVNHSQLEAAAKVIEAYLSNYRQNMGQAEQEVTALSSTWQGSDSTLFQSQWRTASGPDSISNHMTKSLEKYVDFLRFAASQYKSAQAKAIDRANHL